MQKIDALLKYLRRQFSVDIQEMRCVFDVVAVTQPFANCVYSLSPYSCSALTAIRSILPPARRATTEVCDPNRIVGWDGVP